MKNITFTMLKPDSVSKGNIGKIIDKIIQDGFEIVAMKYTRLSIEDASEFYSIHSERPFFGDLISYMTSGPIVAAVLKKENAVEDFRKLIGSTNPIEAEKGTIRNLFADSISENAIHGSDSDENAIIESNFHFEKDEIFQ
ncbi:MAG: nucleoside-diphosphate kinase [Flavobacteriaceae bacterium]|jgi:nucleoside-diphosphate kinase|tara:strand:- start:322 stop:741 length:420 start_codon:yes stop_codon:yes gene_type:complete